MRLRLTVLAPLVSFVLVGACGGGSDAPPDAQPSGDDAVFVSGDFGDVPIHPLADAVGEKSNAEGVVAQSFRLRNTSREELFSWYEERLDGWVQEARPQPIGDSPQASWRARWTRSDRRLIVTVSEAPTLSQEGSSTDDVVLQYSLSLEPADRPLPDAGS